MNIAFYKSHNGKLLDKTISWVTSSQYSHCELIFTDGICASASPRDGGVRFKYINMGDRWDVFTLPDIFNEQIARDWFIRHEDQKYDFIGALGSAFRLDLTSSTKKFCSYSCAMALCIPNPLMSPGELFTTLQNNRII